ncbi:MAG: glycosyltransferase [Saccharofermentans sp.]|nr:glycosyltransferase [Saccharofermentans sp.]
MDSRHTFVIPAYKESAYLEDCIKSVINQTVPGEVLIATATPNEHIKGLSDKYGIKLFVHEPGELAGDWNNALECADTPLVTIAHQDDVYESNFREEVLKAVDEAYKPIIAFTDYAELRGSDKVTDNRNLRIKKMLLFPLRRKSAWKSRFLRRRVLSLGSAICCPSVTINRDNVELPLFLNNMKSNIDWQAWEMLTRKDGSFVYIHRVLMCHRIHGESTTSELIGQNKRRDEDIFMFNKFWPMWVAKFIEHFYIKSESSNDL